MKTQKTLYQKVMAFPLPRPSPTRDRSPRFKGKIVAHKKAKALRTHKDINIKDLMYIALESEVDDPLGQQKEFYQKHLKKLNRQQLTQLMRKIKKIGKTLVLDSEEEKGFSSLQQLAGEVIDSLLASSLEEMENLLEKIDERLTVLPPLKDTASKAELRKFAKTHFADIIDEYDRLVREEKIVPNRFEKRGITFVSHGIKNRKSPQLSFP